LVRHRKTLVAPLAVCLLCEFGLPEPALRTGDTRVDLLFGFEDLTVNVCKLSRKALFKEALGDSGFPFAFGLGLLEWLRGFKMPVRRVNAQRLLFPPW